ncbi:metal-dependent protein hydrolase [Kalaharituber pfeilii]|nr:metal-dependent protein hydrolase [Kalaharituber pfeilii]
MSLAMLVAQSRFLSTRALSTMASPPNRLKTAPLSIGTHKLADEALAVYMLRLLPDYQDATLVRSRDPELLEACDIIVDVQGQYDGIKHFDHHQPLRPRIISERLSLSPDHPNTTILLQKLYNEFIEALDANDNGISAYPADIKPSFNDKGITLPSIVGALNPEWNNPITDKEHDERFEKASKLIGDIFLQKLDYYSNAWLPARDLVLAGINNRKSIHPSGKILTFEISIPWKDHVFTLEEELGIPADEKPLYVLYGEGPGKNWRIQAVPVAKDSFKSRKPLPEAWRGVRDDKLSELTGIPGGVFVHASGFIGGNKTYEGVLEMAKKALDM